MRKRIKKKVGMKKERMIRVGVGLSLGMGRVGGLGEKGMRKKEMGEKEKGLKKVEDGWKGKKVG